MTKVLFTGITGLLGKYFLLERLSGYEVFGTYNKNSSFKSDNIIQLDITREKEVSKLIRDINPKIVVHSASLGNVDYCETHKDEAFSVNVTGTKNIIEACQKVDARIIFISSNAVFDGEKPPYSEDSKRQPLDFYGETKVKGEELVKNSRVSFNIVRLMTMYGWNNAGERGNPVTWMIDQLKLGKKINVVTDIYNNHLYAGQAAEVLWKIVDNRPSNETYNFAGADCLSRYDLALKVSQVFGLDSSLVNPVKNNFFRNIAPRPKNTCFATGKIKRDLGILPLEIDEGLKMMKNEKY